MRRALLIISLLISGSLFAQTPNPNVTLTGVLQGPNGLPLANSVISLTPTQTFFVAGLGSSSCSGFSLEINGNGLTCGDTVNFNAATPSAPTNGHNVIFATSNSGTTDFVTAAIVGDGDNTHCLTGVGQFVPCPTATLPFTYSGNTTELVTTTGPQTAGNCVTIDSFGNHVPSGAPCGSGGSGNPSPPVSTLQANIAGSFSGVVGTIVTPSSGNEPALVNIADANAIHYNAGYNFSVSPTSPSTLASGSNTVTMPGGCPAGVYGTDTAANKKWHYVEIVSVGGDSSPNEPALITGGSCAGGTTSGTITFSAAFTHNAGYQITSATSGVQEMLSDAGQSLPFAKEVILPSHSSFPLLAPLYLTNQRGVLDAGGSLLQCFFNDSCVIVGNRSSMGVGNALTYQQQSIYDLTVRPGAVQWTVYPSGSIAGGSPTATLTVASCPAAFYPTIPNQLLWLAGAVSGKPTTPYGIGEYVIATGGTCLPGGSGTIIVQEAIPTVTNLSAHDAGFTLSNNVGSAVEDEAQDTRIYNLELIADTGMDFLGHMLQIDNDQDAACFGCVSPSSNSLRGAHGGGYATITAATESGNTMTFTTAYNPTVGWCVIVSGVTPAGYNTGGGNPDCWVVLTTSSTTFTAYNSTSGLGNGSVFGKVIGGDQDYVGSVYYGMGEGNAGLLHVNGGSMSSPASCVDWWNGNDILIDGNIICQGFTSWGMRFLNNLGGAGTKHIGPGVHFENGAGYNPLGMIGAPNIITSEASSSQVIVDPGVAIPGGYTSGGSNAAWPIFLELGGAADTRYYWIAPHNSTLTGCTSGGDCVGAILPLGLAIVTDPSANNVTLTIPALGGASSYDILGVQSGTAAIFNNVPQAPYGTGNFLVGTLTVDGTHCNTHAVCTFVDNVAPGSLTSYTVLSDDSTGKIWYPRMFTWTGSVVAGSNTDGTAPQPGINYSGPNACLTTVLYPTTPNLYSPNNLNISGTYPGSGGYGDGYCIPQAHTQFVEDYAGVGSSLSGASLKLASATSALKGRINFGFQNASNGIYDLLTLADSNWLKTLSSPGTTNAALLRPLADANDSFIGFDGLNGAVAFGAQTSLSDYIGMVQDGASWIDRKTATGATYSVPLTLQQNLNILGTCVGCGPFSPTGTQVTDNFNRANGSLGANWTTPSGTWSIVSNQAQVATAAGYNNAIYTGSSFANDQYASIQLVNFKPSGANTSMGVGVRMNSANTDGYFCYSDGNSSAGMLKIISGSPTSLTTFGTIPLKGDILSLQVVGTTLTCFDNGVSLGSVTDSARSSGNPGMQAANYQVILDNFKGGNLAWAATAGLTVNNFTVTGTCTGCTGSQAYPAAGIMVSTGSAFGTSLTAPSGTIVGTTDTQTLTGKSIAGSEINSSTVGATYGGTGIDTHASTGVPQIVSGTWTIPSTVANTYGGTGLNTSASTGVPQVVSGTWTVPSTVSATYGGLGANESSATGVVQFSSGTSSVSSTLANGTKCTTQSPGDNSTNCATTAYADTLGALKLNINNGAPTGTFDASATTSFKVSAGAGFTTSANGQIGFDSTAGNYHLYNGADLIAGLISGAITTTDCAQFIKTGSKVVLTDAGGACGTSSMVYPSAGVGVSTGSAWTTSLTVPTGSITQLTGTVYSGTAVMPTGTLLANTCSSVVTNSASGVTPGSPYYDVVKYGFSANPTSISQFNPTNGNPATIITWAGTNTANVEYCNYGSGSITLQALTLNLYVQR